MIIRIIMGHQIPSRKKGPFKEKGQGNGSRRGGRWGRSNLWD